jgi:preprotein translocase subunit YajC
MKRDDEGGSLHARIRTFLPVAANYRRTRGGNTVLINEAWAQAAVPGGADIMSMLPIILMFVVLYFVMIRPQMKRAKEHKAMVDALQKGDEVIAAGGVLGKVTKVADNYVTIEIADKLEIKVQRPAVQLVLPKGTVKGVE